jgi:hypothetical protein
LEVVLLTSELAWYAFAPRWTIYTPVWGRIDILVGMLLTTIDTV